MGSVVVMVVFPGDQHEASLSEGEAANPGRAVHLFCLRQQLGRAGGGTVRFSGCKAGAQLRAGRQDSGEGCGAD